MNRRRESVGPIDWIAFAELVVLWIILMLVIGASVLTGCSEKRFAVDSITGITQVAPAELEKWVPRDISADSIAATRDSTEGPVLWLWPGGPVNLVAVRVGVWCGDVTGQIGRERYHVLAAYQGGYTGQLSDGLWGALTVSDWPDSLGVATGTFTATLDADSVLQVRASIATVTPCRAQPDTTWRFYQLVREGR